jgi:hypothetical protein
MTKFSHLTNAEYRAVQCQVLAAEYAARARKLRDTRWFNDAADAAMWSAQYAASARALMNVEVQ